MRRILSQVIILVLFLFLTVFASVWFEDTGGDESVETSKSQSIVWFSQAAQKTWQIIDGLAGIASPKSMSDSPSAGVSVTSNSVVGATAEINNITQNLGDLAASPAIAEMNSDGNFSEFIGSFFKKAPSLYFDTKVYSNGWRNFWSLYWLEYKNLSPDKD